MTPKPATVLEFKRGPSPFLARHPYVLSDGRRFGTLICAAMSVRMMPAYTTVTNEQTGTLYTWRDCIEECRRHGVRWV